jgi:hypothetical protein
VLLTGSKLGQYIGNLVDQLPGPLRTLGRYALITKDTALFRGLEKAVEYGDFLAKAVTHEHLMKNKGKSSEEASAHITEEFIHNDRLSIPTSDGKPAVSCAELKYTTLSCNAAF